MEREGMTIEEYISIHNSGEHKYAVTNSYGVYDYFKYYRHNRPRDKSYYKMNEYQYYKLIRTVNEYLVDLLFKNARVELPNRLGELVIMNNEPRVYFKDGKLKTNRPINWDATIRLWFEDPEAEKKKTLIRWESDRILGIFYKKNNAVYQNKTFYEFQIIRRIKQRLSQAVKEETFDTPFFVDSTIDSIKALYND